MRAFRLLLSVALVMVLPTPAAAAETEQAPESPGKPVTATVVFVSGGAQKMQPADGDNSWEALAAGQELGELTIIRTGLRSKVVLTFADRTEVTIGSGTKIGIAEARSKDTLARTHLGLKYGSVRAKVDSKVGPSDFRVRTPVATLSIRGSESRFGYTCDGGARGESLAGLLSLRAGGRRRTINPGEQIGDRLRLPIDLAVRRFFVRMGDTLGGLSPVERRILDRNRDGLGIIGSAGGRPSRRFLRRLRRLIDNRTGQ